MQNNYIFGAEADEIDRLKKEGYKPEAYAEKHSYAVESRVDGTFSDGGTGWFKELYESLLNGASWHKPDNYFVLYDLESYVNALIKINCDFSDRNAFAAKQLANVAGSAYFSSDRTVTEYATLIWGI